MVDLEENIVSVIDTSTTNGSTNESSTNFGYLKDHESQTSSLSSICGDPVTDFNNNDHDGRHNSVTTLLPSKLSWKTKFFYSLGHVYNDLTVSIWFSYTLLFFQYRFSGSLGGSLILLGQIADALASPFVGYESDKSAKMWLCSRYGRRKTWHLLGVIMNTISVPLVYNQCFACNDAPEWSQFVYYGVLVFIFQAGWAATQVSHVSLITDLTSDTTERIALNSYRQAATIGSNICLYTVAYFVITAAENKNGDGDGPNTIQKDDLVIFTTIAYIVCVIGVCFAILFHIFVHEPNAAPRPRKVRSSVFTVETKRYLRSTRGSQGIITLLANQKDESVPSDAKRFSISYQTDPVEFERRVKVLKSATQKQWYHWFRSLSFWKITIMYTFARMFFNVTQVYTPLYLQHFLLLPKQTIAINPFATYIAGFIFSFVAKPLSARFGSRVTLVVGAAFGVSTSVWIFFGEDSSYKQYQVYVVAAFLGIAGTGLLIASLSMTSDLIGSNTATGAFVFAAMSFFDKSINGVVIALLEQFKPSDKTTSVGGGNVAQPYYKYVMVTLTGLPSILAVLFMLTIISTNYGRRSRANSIASPSPSH